MADTLADHETGGRLPEREKWFTLAALILVPLVLGGLVYQSILDL